MKMFKYIIGSGAFMLLASIIGTACTDGNDWDVDSAHDRLFSVTASKILLFLHNRHLLRFRGERFPMQNIM